MKNLKLNEKQWVKTIVLVLVIVFSTICLGVTTYSSVEQPAIKIATKMTVPTDTSFTENTVDEDYLNAIEHLKAFEGFRSKVYRDVNGSKTIGYGHHLLKGERYTVINDSIATLILENDLQVRLEHIENTYNISGDTLLAFALFSFNCGIGTLDNALNNGLLTDPTKLLQYCHYKVYDSKSNAIWHTSKKLLQRREYELALITN